MGQKSDNLLKVKNKKIKRKPDVVAKWTKVNHDLNGNTPVHKGGKIKRKPDVVAKRIKLDYDLNGNTPVRKGTIQTILSKEISSD